MNLTAQIKFIPASVLPLSEDLCAPTNKTGTVRFSKIKDKAAPE